MEQVFGALTPFTIMLVITLLTQWVKNSYPQLSQRQVQYVALGFSVVLIGTYQVITTWPITALGAFSAFVFSLLGWFAAIGMYEVASKQLAKPVTSKPVVQ